MLKGLVQKVVGTRFQREMKRMQPIVDEIKRHEEQLADVSEDELKARTEQFRARIRERTKKLEDEIESLREERRQTEDSSKRADLSERIRQAEEGFQEATDEVLDELLPEAFATVREACRRMLGRDIDVTGHNMTWDMVPY
ncbi:MAG: hypothetical protein KAJ43_07930, partial [Gemmatimonadetes bacterium]|nr:hypothetical protein [Gemmatimonadota bacterium]